MFRYFILCLYVNQLANHKIISREIITIYVFICNLNISVIIFSKLINFIILSQIKSIFSGNIKVSVAMILNIWLIEYNFYWIQFLAIFSLQLKKIKTQC